MKKYATTEELYALDDAVCSLERKQNLHYSDLEVRVYKLENALLALAKRVFAMEQERDNG